MRQGDQHLQCLGCHLSTLSSSPDPGGLGAPRAAAVGVVLEQTSRHVPHCAEDSQILGYRSKRTPVGARFNHDEVLAAIDRSKPLPSFNQTSFTRAVACSVCS